MWGLAAIVIVANPVFASQPEIALGSVEVTASRPVSMTGISKLTVDSASMRRSISLSMADVVAFTPGVFVKTSGRATMSTVSMRGASASHTLVEWNGLPVNSPMLGSTDFSLLPAYFIDRASLFYGGSSIALGSGGLGGGITLDNSLSDLADGFSARYIQGIGSFMTFDEFLAAGYSRGAWKAETRVALSTSRNDFTYLNRDKKLNIYDDDHNIIEQYHPREKNSNGAYRDLNVMQQVEWRPGARNIVALRVWWTDSHREIPLTTVDYSGRNNYENLNRDNTLRAIGSWQGNGNRWRLKTSLGYIRTWNGYDYGFDNGSGVMNRLTTSRTHLSTLQASASADYSPLSPLWLSLSGRWARNSIDSRNLASLTNDPGWDSSRNEGDLSLSARWQFAQSSGISLVVREQLLGSTLSPVTASLLADWQVTPQLSLRASAGRNAKMPTLSDLYFIPGGNPSLRPEKSISFDCGATYIMPYISVSANGYFSRIDDMIQWLPTVKGFFSPRNVKRVHSYGIELSARSSLNLGRGWQLDLNGNYSWTPSRNHTPGLSSADKSYGRQLPYIPLHTASLSALAKWRRWELNYRINYYSRRYTMSSNEPSPTGSVPPYLMNDMSLQRTIDFNRLSLVLKLALNNLFDVDYMTILAHPMPGFNLEFYFGLSF